MKENSRSCANPWFKLRLSVMIQRLGFNSALDLNTGAHVTTIKIYCTQYYQSCVMVATLKISFTTFLFPTIDWKFRCGRAIYSFSTHLYSTVVLTLWKVMHTFFPSIRVKRHFYVEDQMYHFKNNERHCHLFLTKFLTTI